MLVLIEIGLREIADDLGLEPGQIFSLLREVLTGQEASPPIMDVIDILGRETVIKRLEKAHKVFARVAQR